LDNILLVSFTTVHYLPLAGCFCGCTQHLARGTTTIVSVTFHKLHFHLKSSPVLALTVTSAQTCSSFHA